MLHLLYVKTGDISYGVEAKINCTNRTNANLLTPISSMESVGVFNAQGICIAFISILVIILPII